MDIWSTYGICLVCNNHTKIYKSYESQMKFVCDDCGTRLTLDNFKPDRADAHLEIEVIQNLEGPHHVELLIRDKHNTTVSILLPFSRVEVSVPVEYSENNWLKPTIYWKDSTNSVGLPFCPDRFYGFKPGKYSIPLKLLPGDDVGYFAMCEDAHKVLDQLFTYMNDISKRKRNYVVRTPSNFYRDIRYLIAEHPNYDMFDPAFIRFGEDIFFMGMDYSNLVARLKLRVFANTLLARCNGENEIDGKSFFALQLYEDCTRYEEANFYTVQIHKKYKLDKPDLRFIDMVQRERDASREETDDS